MVYVENKGRKKVCIVRLFFASNRDLSNRNAKQSKKPLRNLLEQTVVVEAELSK